MERVVSESKIEKIMGEPERQEQPREEKRTVQQTYVMPEGQHGNVLLFTTKTCPNCKIAASMLKKAHMDYEKIDAEEEVQLTEYHHIRQAPTLVVTHGDHVETYAGAAGIKKYLESR